MVLADAINAQNAPGKMPPSISRFCPVMKPACAEHRNAQAAPNSSAWPSRLAGIVGMRCFSACSTVMPCFLAVISCVGAQPVGVERPRQQEIDGDVVLRDRAGDAGEERGQPRARAGRQVEADQRHLHRAGRDVDDAPELVLDHRVDRRCISSTGTIMLPTTPSIIFWRSSSRKSRNGGPALLAIRMSGSGQAANSAAWPSLVATSAATAMHLGAGRFADIGRGGVKPLRIAPVDHDLAAGFGEPHGAGAPEPAARGADDGLAAGNSEIHAGVLLVGHPEHCARHPGHATAPPLIAPRNSRRLTRSPRRRGRGAIADTVMPSAFAVVRLKMRSNLVGCSTGRSLGVAPRKILST